MAAKHDEIMNARSQGMKLALKMVEEGGIDVLREEIRYRGITGISTANSKHEMEYVTKLMQKRSTQTAIAISLETLMDTFAMGRSQAWQFKTDFDKKVDKICEDDGDMSGMLERIKDNLGIVITFDEF